MSEQHPSDPPPHHDPYHHAQQPYYYPPPPPKNGNGGVALDKVTVNIVLVLVAGFFLCGSIWYGAVQFSNLQHSIDRLDAKVTAMNESVSERISRVEDEMASKLTGRYTLADHDLFCARTEIENPGWRCGGSLRPRAEYVPERTWTAETKKTVK